MNRWMKWGRWTLVAEALLLVGYLLARPYLWLRQPGAVVSFDGRPTSLAAVYRAFDGRLLVWIDEPGGGAPYIVCPSEGYVFEGHGGSIWESSDYLVGPLLALNRTDAYINGYLRGSLLRWPSEKLGVDPRVVLRPGHVEFTEEMSWKAPGIVRRVRVKF